MPFTMTILKEFASRALGGAATETAGPTHERIVNAAGQALYGMHSWRFRIRPPVILPFVNGQEYVNLPADLARVRDYRLNGLTQDFSFTSSQHLARLRDHAITPVGFHWWGVITQPMGASTFQPMPAPRIEIYPTPTSDQTKLAIWYVAKWFVLDDDAQFAQIPWYAENLLIDLVQAYAEGWVEDQHPYAYERIADISKGLSFRDAKREDKLQPDLGVIMGGSVEGMEWSSLGYLPYSAPTLT